MTAPGVAGARAGGGFTLLEVAVAMAILGVGVVTVLELFSAGLRVQRASGVRARAVAHARTLLDQTITLPELVPAEERGQFGDGYRWERRVREAREFTDASGRDLDVQSELTMYEIEVAVLWAQSPDREGVYAIRTLRVAPAPAG